MVNGSGEFLSLTIQRFKACSTSILTFQSGMLEEPQDGLDVETSSVSSATSGHYSTADSRSNRSASSSRSRREFIPHYLLRLPPSSTHLPPPVLPAESSVEHAPVLPAQECEEVTPSPIPLTETSAIPTRPKVSPIQAPPWPHATATFWRKNTISSTSPSHHRSDDATEVVESSGVSSYTARTTRTGRTVTIRPSSAYRIRRNTSSTYLDNDASSFFAQPAIARKKKETEFSERVMLALKALLSPLFLPVGYCLGLTPISRKPPAPHFPDIHSEATLYDASDDAPRESEDECLTFAPGVQQEAPGPIHPPTIHAISSASSSQDSLLMIKQLEAKVRDLEEALKAERRKREVLTASHQAEFKKLYRMFRETLVGQGS